MMSLCNSYKLTNLLDLILTKKPRSFQNTSVLETVLSDFHWMTVSVMKMTFRKLSPKRFSYQDYRNFDNSECMNSIHCVLSTEENEIQHKDLNAFFKICLELLNNLAPRKKKYIRGNNKPFMTKELLKAFMQRSRLLNKLLSDPSEENLQSKKFCVSL